MSAEIELTRLQREHGPRLIKGVIRKDKPPKRWTSEVQGQEVTASWCRPGTGTSAAVLRWRSIHNGGYIRKPREQAVEPAKGQG